MDTSFNGAYPNFLMQHCRLWGGGNRPVIKRSELVFGANSVLARLSVRMARPPILFLGIDPDSIPQRLFASRVISETAFHKQVFCLESRKVFDIRQRYPGQVYSVNINACNDILFFAEGIEKYAEGTDAIGLFGLCRTSIGNQWFLNSKRSARLCDMFDALIGLPRPVL